MGGNGGAAVPCSASYAFMGRLDSFTSSIYPHELGQNQDTEDGPCFTVNSWAALYPVLASIVQLTVHLLRPYAAVGMLVATGLGFANIYCAAVGAALLAYLCLFDERFGQMFLGHMPPLPPGLHCHRSARTDAVVSMVPALRFPYYKGTPWIIGGDIATMYPFLAFRVPAVEYTRRWLTVPADDTKKTGGNHDFSGDKDVVDDTFDGSTLIGDEDPLPLGSNGGRGVFGVSHEAVALDVALPKTGLDPTKPFYIVLHGLNGGSAEPYVLDFVAHALERGCGVCVMIARGCMDTPVHGPSLFHGARTSDVRYSVRVLRKTLPAETPLAMVGYSMGGIVASNYAALSGDNSGLSCCVSMSGSFDSRTNMTFWHSQRLWQPLLARSLKENFVVNQTRKILARGLNLSDVERSGDVLDFDTHMVAPYNGYASVTDYYIDMSAAAEGKLAGLRTPMLAVSAMDDPIMTAGGLPINEMEKTKDLYVLLTRTGGHVGWATGWLPNRNNWSWMSTTSLDFCEAIIATASL